MNKLLPCALSQKMNAYQIERHCKPMASVSMHVYLDAMMVAADRSAELFSPVAGRYILEQRLHGLHQGVPL